MKTSKDDPDAEYRKMLAPLADQLVRSAPERRRQAVADMLPCSAPKPLRLLAELLVARLEYKDPKVRDGAAATLALLCPHVLPTIRWALMVKPTERRLLHLADVVLAISRGLSDRERADLLTTLLIAVGLAPTPESRGALEAALWHLREVDFEEHRVEYQARRREDEEAAAELIARYSATGRKSRARPGQSTSPESRSSPTRSAS